MVEPLSKEEQLKCYEQALKTYKENLWKSSFINRDCRVSTGFCKYFANTYATSYVKEKFPILFNLRNGYKYKKNNNYWFRPGKLRPRIKLLERAIEICKSTNG